MADFFDMGDLPDSVWSGVASWDHLTWSSAQKLKVVQHANDEARKYSNDLGREAFFGMLNGRSRLTERSPQGLKPVHSIMERAGKMPEFDQLRRSIKGDDVAAGIATAQFVTQMMKNLPEEVKEKMEKHQKAKNRLQQLHRQAAGQNGGQKSGMGAGQSGQPGDEEGDGPGGGGEGQAGDGEGEEGFGGEKMTDEALRRAIEEAKAEEEETAKMVDESLDASSAQIENNLSRSMSNAASRIQDLRDTQQMMSWGSGAVPNKLVEDEANDLIELVEFLQSRPDLLKLFDMLGWAEAMIDSESKNQIIGKENLVDYVRGHFDAEQIAPKELLALATDPEGPLFLDFIARFNSEILLRKFEGEEKAGKGPVIYVKDTSGSTAGEVFAMLTAIDFALYKHLEKEHRSYACIPFSSEGQFHVWKPAKDPVKALKGIVGHLRQGYFGGTEPYAPLTKALELIREDPDFKKGYILLGTDGAFSSPPPAFLKLLAEVRKNPGVEIYAFVIGSTPGAANFCDKVVLLNGVGEKDKLVQVMAPVL